MPLLPPRLPPAGRKGSGDGTRKGSVLGCGFKADAVGAAAIVRQQRAMLQRHSSSDDCDQAGQQVYSGHHPL